MTEHGRTIPTPSSRLVRIEPDTPTRLGDRPQTTQLAGTHFDVNLSRALGFESYPVGGNIGYVSRVVAECWGQPWVYGGWIDIEFRRPLYGDTDVALDFQPVRELDGSLVTDYTFTYRGDVCWKGQAGIPLDPVKPPKLADFPATPGAMPNFIEAPNLIGANLPTRDLIFERSIFDVARDGHLDAIDAPATWYGNCYKRVARDVHDLKESQPWLLEDKIVTPWQAFPGLLDTTGAHFTMQVAAKYQFFAPVRADEPLQFRSRLIDAYERKGSQYAVHDHLLVAGKTVLMLNQWRVLYDFAKAKETGGLARE